MLVSIITSVYNCEQYVGEMIDSIISQSFEDWELIIFDDASTDSTWDIISSYSDERIVSYRNKTNMGLTVNLNRAWDLSHGDYLLRIDGDDIAYSGRIQKQLEYMNTHPNTVILGGGMTLIGDVQEMIVFSSNPEVNKVNLIFDAVVGHPTMMIRKLELNKYNIRYDESLRYAQDYGLEYCASQVGDISNISECVIKRRMHKEQVSQKSCQEQCVCADKTRMNILKDLGVVLSESEFQIWSKFCTNDFSDIQDKAKEIEDICDQVVKNNALLGIFDDELLKKSLNKRFERLMNMRTSDASQVYNRYEHMFRLQSRWVSNIQKDLKIGDWMILNGIYSIAIYGMGFMGKNLVDEVLENSKVRIMKLMDRDVIGDYKGIKIDNDRIVDSKVDGIVITVVSQYEKVRESFEAVYGGRFFSLEDIIHEVALMKC